MTHPSADAHASPHEILLKSDWRIRSSAGLTDGGAVISTPDCDLDGWLPTGVPSTVLAALVSNGVYADLYLGRNLEQVPTEPFAEPWWYRTEFTLEPDGRLTHARLGFDGVNYRANVWLNGRQVATAHEVFGAFRRFELDLTESLRAGANVLAVEVFPPQRGEFTIGFVDWNPAPPDGNMGIWREVRLLRSGPVSIADPFVRSKVDLETLADAELTVGAELVNQSDGTVSGVLEGEIEGRRFSREVALEAGECRDVRLGPADCEPLRISPARLWWPHQMGEPNLYDLKLRFRIGGAVSDEKTVRFGIREVADYWTDEGYRGYAVNGRKVLILGGGWVDDLLLADDDDRLEAQVRYVKHMNLNTIRLEGFWGSSQRLYDLCDEHGLLLMAGWSCQWEWENYAGKPDDEFGCIKSEEDMALIARSFRDQVVYLRNHPSIFVWLVGSDKLPRPALEREYADILAACDPGRPCLGAAKMLKSEVSGSTGVKMTGPYAYVPPVYWYAEEAPGGALGFNTETGPGAQPPPLAGLKKMIPPEHLWPPDDVWDYHCARGEFGSIGRYHGAMSRRYGEPGGVEEFCRMAQIASYEAMRPMFEAFRARKHRATGVIQWMLNAAWPKLYWQLYDYYLMPNGAFYGARKACEPVHVLYDYAGGDVCVANGTLAPIEGLDVQLRVVDLGGQEVLGEEAQVNAPANASVPVLRVPEVQGLDSGHFLRLTLTDAAGVQVSDNVYWLSGKMDVMDFEGTKWFVTPIREHADLTGLRRLPPARLDVAQAWQERGGERAVGVTLSNPGDVVAFGVELSVVREQSGEPVLPIFWDDNYLTLFPGESRQVTARFAERDLHGDEPLLRVEGWNVKTG
ncbi:MAG: hypothetical protein AMK73_04805 [Planctomycetes bacterium SM23_32]|nr:MAG: hypothetical protein AMK73_04805 [Planctomycetes bacterium SM23_32]